MQLQEIILFSDLKPILQLNSGTKVYGAESFPQNLAETVILTDAPKDPSIILADSAIVWKEDEPSRWLIRDAQTILTFHGCSKKSEFWKQQHAPHKDVEKVIEEIMKENYFPDILSICNPDGYILPNRFNYSQVYFRSFVRMDALFRNSSLMVRTFGDYTQNYPARINSRIPSPSSPSIPSTH